MEEDISSILAAIKERSRNVCTSHMKHYVWNLKNVYVDELELSELVLKRSQTQKRVVMRSRFVYLTGAYLVHN